jgi:dynein heavy chain
MKIEDIIFICAMGPPGGGRSPLTKRLERHFNIITYTNLGKESITMIFQKILYAFLAGFSEPIAKCLDDVVEATQRVYNAVATNLKPTPSKSHYTFNLRDMSKIFQGLCAAQQKTTTQVLELVRLWIHENQRVFGDRMISQEDRDTLNDLLNVETVNTFKLTREQVYLSERIIFGDYINGIDGENRPYVWIQDLKDLVKKIEGYLDDFNSG